ncbi:hypothetical protein MHU86_9860 [Fragilaria crotonensis]|nr:hypothetical protein MHU86_9860 [Fragilaria crotonensis]
MEANHSSATMTHGSIGGTLSGAGYSAGDRPDAPRRVVQGESSSQVRPGSLQQLQQLRDDMIRKSAIQTESSSTFSNNNIPLSEEVKVGLAVQLSIVGVPGAHTSNLPGGNTRKPQAPQDTSSRTRDMDDSALSDSVSVELNPINDLQMRMRTFRLQTFKEDVVANESMRRKNKRRATAIVLVVIVAAIVGTIVGVLLTTKTIRRTTNPRLLSKPQAAKRCLRDMKTDLDTKLSAPNAALCWLSMYDEFPLEIEDGNHTAFDTLVQRFALATIFYRFEGTAALTPREGAFGTWLSSSDVCQWSFAIECSDPGVVNGLHFNSKNLNGSLPSELALLTNLVHLEFETGTMLTGEIPSELWRLTLLETLIIPNTFVNGTLSYDVRNLSELQALNLFNSAISGTIPDLSTLSKLTLLEIVSDLVYGQLPDVGALTKLAVLSLGSSLLSATLPAGISKLSKLGYMYMLNVDSVPTEIGMLSSLEVVNFEYTSYGTLPTELGNLSNLRELDLGAISSQDLFHLNLGDCHV